MGFIVLMNMSRWRNELEAWLGTIDVNCDSVLDIGGAQKPIYGRTKSWEVQNYKVLDITLPKPFDISSQLVGEYTPADTVFCLETLMYATDPVQAIRNLLSLTKKDLYISNPLEGYPETKPADMDMSRLMPNWFNYHLNGLDFSMDIIYPADTTWSMQACAIEGYKVYRPHASGILIHVQK